MPSPSASCKPKVKGKKLSRGTFSLLGCPILLSADAAVRWRPALRVQITPLKLDIRPAYVWPAVVTFLTFPFRTWPWPSPDQSSHQRSETRQAPQPSWGRDRLKHAARLRNCP
ncbi:hypothetical protein LZ32DRAFT_336958 [Colletotrichum eremochloae]|nr:hypothetical protein LZ32DRAFT_336958 [Colletotrichum eremochloae]